MSVKKEGGKNQFGFDGQGINDYSNEYHNQLAKLTQAGKEAGIGPLLASAPMLYEACKKACMWADDSAWAGKEKIVEMLEQALASAEGRES